MKKTSVMLVTAAALVMSTSVHAADKETYDSQTKIEKDANGSYSEKDKTVNTDPSGKTTVEKKVDAQVSSNGTTDKTVETENTHKSGWFDKDSVKTKDTEKTSADGTVEVTHKKVINGTTTENYSNKTTPAQ